MIATIVALLILCQHMSTSESTRLPLEVYELTPGATATFAAATATSTATLAEHKADNNLNYLKRKNLEYSTIKTNKSSATSITMTDVTGDHDHDDDDDDGDDVGGIDGAGVSEDEADLDILNVEEHNIIMQQESDRRKSRKMLDVIKQHMSNDIKSSNKNLYKTNRNNRENNSNPNKIHEHNEKDVRVLYQVGESEEDLPLCAQNAICSKIDLYETPWIERQCRCPESTHHTIEHHIHQHHDKDNDNNNNNQNNKLYRSFYERDKILQHRRLLAGVDATDEKFDTFHLRKIMQKLGAVYENDLQLQPSDYLLTSVHAYAEHNIEENDALPGLLEMPSDENQSSSSAEDDFPTHIQSHRMPAQAHMRHEGHHFATTKPLLNARMGNCPSGLDINDGHTIADKTRHYKLCQPIHKFPICKHFRDYTWTLRTSLEMNVTEQIVHCRCPRNSVTYLTKREAAENGLNGYVYYFACSPVTRLRCRRKQPCKLFTVRKRQEFLDEVNINALCQCPKGHTCPSRHTHLGVIAGESFLEDNIQTYSGYCMAND